MTEVVGQHPKSLKRPHSRLEHASHTGVSGAFQVGLSGNLGECNNSSSIEVVAHRKVLELQYALHKEARGRLQPALYRGCSKVRNNHLLGQNKQMTYWRSRLINRKLCHLLEHYHILLWQMTNIRGDEKLEHIQYFVLFILKHSILPFPILYISFMHGQHRPPKIDRLLFVRHCYSLCYWTSRAVQQTFRDTLLIGQGYPVLCCLNKHCDFHTSHLHRIRNLLHRSPRVASKRSALGCKNFAFYRVAFSGCLLAIPHKNLCQVPYVMQRYHRFGYSSIC